MSPHDLICQTASWAEVFTRFQMSETASGSSGETHFVNPAHVFFTRFLVGAAGAGGLSYKVMQS
jgi:hypothetical protein